MRPAVARKHNNPYILFSVDGGNNMLNLTTKHTSYIGLISLTGNDTLERLTLLLFAEFVSVRSGHGALCHFVPRSL